MLVDSGTKGQATQLDRTALLYDKLQEAFQPLTLVVEDESAKHAGHLGARSGAGHFRVLIVSEKFSNLPPLERHRAVYSVLQAEFHSAIHALALETLTPEEWLGQQSEVTETTRRERR